MRQMLSRGLVHLVGTQQYPTSHRPTASRPESGSEEELKRETLDLGSWILNLGSWIFPGYLKSSNINTYHDTMVSQS